LIFKKREMNKFTSMATLDALSSDAPPLPLHLSNLLLKPISVNSELPDFEAICEGFELPRERCEEKKRDEDRLPNRIVSGVASGLELGLWKSHSLHCAHEVLSAEYIEGIVQSVKELLSEGDGGGETVCLEIGAGTGLLSEYLRPRLKGFCEVVAVDDFTSSISAVTSVVEMGCEEALNKYKPKLVICSWMPPGRDFSDAIAKCDSVHGYLLLGEADSSTCGDRWATWGVPPEIGCKKCDFEGCGRCDLGIYEDTPKPYAERGFSRSCVDSIQSVQICRFDSNVCRGYSSATLFTRIMAK
jgi:hypothetical protein